MSKNKVKSVSIISGTGVNTYEVGRDGVTRIDNNSEEYPDHSEVMLSVWVDDKLKAEVLNCPVDIVYGIEGVD